MENFTYYTPTKVVFGKGTENQVGALVKEEHCKKVLVHFGGQSAKRSGLLDRIFHSLTEEGVPFVSLGGVVPNPRLSLVYEGIELCRREGVDFILAVGGGSVIDSAKAIGYGVVHDFDVWDLYDWKQKPTGCLPIGCVLTIAASGSEMSDSSVITKDEGNIKRGLNHPACRARFAVMNPELTYSLPQFQTACGVADILMHTLERYFIPGEPMEMTDAIAEGLLCTVIHNGLILLEEPENYRARAEVMWAGSLSHNGLTGCGGTGDWSTHQLGHEISGLFDSAHGAALTSLWGSWARYVVSCNPARFARLARRVLGVTAPGDDAAALLGIEAMEELFRDLNLPVSLSELLGRTLTEEELENCAARCAHHGRTIGSFRVLDKSDILAIYRMANH